MRRQATVSLETEDDLDLFLKNHSKALVIIDVHQNWCGSCKALIPTMEDLMVQYERSEFRLAFASMETKLSPKLNSSLTLPKSGIFISKSDPSVETTKRVCKTLITREALSAILVDRKSCCPLFLVMKSNQLLGMIEGADAPTFKKFVDDSIPPIEDEATIVVNEIE